MSEIGEKSGNFLRGKKWESSTWCGCHFVAERHVSQDGGNIVLQK